MPVIKPRTRGRHFVRQRIRLEQENHETLHAYAGFIGESADYVVNQVIEVVLGKDKEFAQWRADHPLSHLRTSRPRSGLRRGRSTESTSARTLANADTAPGHEPTTSLRTS